MVMVSPLGNAPFGKLSSILPSAVAILPPPDGMNLLIAGPVGVPIAVEAGVTVVSWLALLLLVETLVFLQFVPAKSIAEMVRTARKLFMLKTFLKATGGNHASQYNKS